MYLYHSHGIFNTPLMPMLPNDLVCQSLKNTTLKMTQYISYPLCTTVDPHITTAFQDVPIISRHLHSPKIKHNRISLLRGYTKIPW